MRNGDGRTPLFLAADATIEVNVSLLRESGAHLHAEEVEYAKLKLKTLKWDQNSSRSNEFTKTTKQRCWELAGA